MHRFIPTLLLLLPAPLQAADKITYDDDIFPIFESKCLNCHNPDKKKGDLDLSTFTGTMAGSSGGKIALAGDGGSSKLFTVTVHTEEPVMPPEGDKISKKQVDLIRAWIDGGLLENEGSKAKKRKKPAFSLEAVPTGAKPEGPPPMPGDLLLEPVVTPARATVVADLESSPWAPLLAVTAPRQVLLYNTDTLELVGVLPFPKGNPETLSFHPGGKYLLAGGGIGGKSGTTVTWDITTGKVLMTMGREFDSVLAADLRADLGGVALGGPARLVKLWDTSTDEQIKSIKKHTDWITALSYSPDGVLLATGDRNNGIQIWEAATGNEFHSLRGHQDAITDLKWRSDSNLIASSSEDGTIRFWDMNRGSEIKKGNAGPGVVALDYARNGQLISAGRDKRIKLWKPDLTIEKQSPPFSDLITEVAFSHDAKRYFTADWNGRIEVWNPIDLKKIGELNAAPPSIAQRLVKLTSEKKAALEELESLRKKSQAARTNHQQALAKISETEATIATLREDSNTHQQQGNSLKQEARKLEQNGQAKLRERNQLDPGIAETNRLKTVNEQEEQKLTVAQKALSRDLTSADQSLVAATRETQAKREAAQKDPDNPEKKAALTEAEQNEHQQRQIVQQLTGKLKAREKKLAALREEHKTLLSTLATLRRQHQSLTTDLQKLLTQKGEALKKADRELADSTTKKARIPELQKQIPILRKASQERQKLSETTGGEVTSTEKSLAAIEGKIKKWQAAASSKPLPQRSE